MLYPENDPFRRHIEDITFVVEGGFMAKVKGDYNTLFGLTEPNFNARAVRRYIDALGPEAFDRLPKPVHDAFVSISHGGSPVPLMRYIGGMLTPLTSHTVAGTHVAVRTSARPNAHANTEAIDAVKDFITFHYDHEYCTKLGFLDYPSSIRFRAMDMAINAAHGKGRANWAIVKAMRESGLLSDREFNSEDYPYITANEASDKTNFAKGHKAAAYASPEMNERIAQRLAHASPEQLELVEYNIDKWRVIFFQERAKDSPYIASVLPGLVNRIRKFGNFGRGAELTEKYANGFMDAQFTAPLGGAVGMEGEIAIEVPGKEGLIRYKVDMKTLEPTTKVELPEGVRWVNREGIDPATGRHAKGGFAGTNTFIWKNHLGQEVRLPITPGLNGAIGQASMNSFISGHKITLPFNLIPGYTSWTVPVIGQEYGLPSSFTRDATGLDREASGHVTLKPQVGRLPYIEVEDKNSEDVFVPKGQPAYQPPRPHRNTKNHR